MNHLKLKVIQERGLIQTTELEVSRTIRENKWEVLCEHPDPVVVPIVREFYANSMEQEDLKVMVKGKLVPFDQTTINRFYELENVANDKYHPMIENDCTNWDEIKNALCKEPVAWKRYQNGGLKSFFWQAMTKVSKIWHYFVCAKLQSITNFSVMMKN